MSEDTGFPAGICSKKGPKACITGTPVPWLPKAMQ